MKRSRCIIRTGIMIGVEEDNVVYKRPQKKSKVILSFKTAICFSSADF